MTYKVQSILLVQHLPRPILRNETHLCYTLVRILQTTYENHCPVVRLLSHGLWSAVLSTVLLEEDSGPTSAKTNLENILHKGESATHEMDAILKKKYARADIANYICIYELYLA